MMIDTKVESQVSESLNAQRLGEDWIQAIAANDLERLTPLCSPRVTSRLLLPGGLVTYSNPADLVARYREWFGDYSDIRVEASRAALVGRRLGIFYRLLLQDQGDTERIEQQLYCILKDGRVSQLHLVCSGFQAVEMNEEVAMMDAQEVGQPDPVRDALLEFHSDAPDTSSTCALLTPMIRSRLKELQSGQVLEVRVNDPEARGDIEAWSRMTGNPLLKLIDDEGPILRFFVKKK